MKKILLFLICYAVFICSIFGQMRKIDSLKRVVGATKDTETTIKLLTDLAHLYWTVNPDSTILYADLAVDIATNSKNFNAKVKALSSVGVGYMYLTDYKNAEKYFKESFKLSDSIGNVKGMAAASNNLGIIFYYQNEYYSSFKHYNQGLMLNRELEDVDAIASSLGNIGLIYIGIGDYEKALTFYKDALGYYEKSKNEKLKGNALGTIGHIYAQLGKYAVAETYLNKAIKINEEHENTIDVGYEHSYLAENYLFQKQYNQAIKHAKLSLKKNEDFDHVVLKTSNYVLLAKGYNGLGDAEKAVKFAEDALDISVKTQNKKEGYAASKFLFDHFKATEDFEKSTKYADYYVAYSDSLKSEQSNIDFFRQKVDFEINSIELKKNKQLAEQRHKQLLIFVCAGLVMFIAIGFLLYINNRQIKRAYKKVAFSNNVKSMFMAKMTHEIKTPLNAVLGCSDLLKRNISDGEELKLVNTISIAANSLLQMTNDILNLANQQKGQTRLKEMPQDIHALVDGVYLMAATKIRKNTITFEKTMDSEIPDYLLIDAPKFQQVLNNLVSNSIKFTHSGFIKISVNLVNEIDEYVTIECSVSDSGIGIRTDYHTKIFEEFFQIQPDALNESSSVGLGLTIASNNLTLMKSKLMLESKLDHGSTFSFRLKLRKAANFKKLNDAHYKQDSLIDRPTSILIVEDNKINLMVLRKMLSHTFKYLKIYEAANGLEGVQAFKQHQPDVIIMDLLMPVMDGYEATRIIRNLQTYQVPIIACSASIIKDDPKMRPELNFDDYINKPYTLELLQAKMFTMNERLLKSDSEIKEPLSVRA